MHPSPALRFGAVLAIALTLAAPSAHVAGAQSPPPPPPWARDPVHPTLVRWDLPALHALLEPAPRASLIPAGDLVELPLPLPGGGVARFAVAESTLLPDELRNRHPSIRAYVGHDLQTPGRTLRLTLTPLGVHAQILGGSEPLYIDPHPAPATPRGAAAGPNTGLAGPHRVAPRSALRAPARPPCAAPATAPPQRPPAPVGPRGPAPTTVPRRTIRLALAATGEFAQHFGGTLEGALAGLVVAAARVDGIYTTELGVSFQLVPQTERLIFLDPLEDPFVNGAVAQMAAANQALLDDAVGDSGYDLGHVLGTGAGGISATLASLCIPGAKGAAASLGDPPSGDAFHVDVLAHELGHQFGATHTFNSCAGSQAGSGPAGVEPGSGITIMSYAGQCAADDLATQVLPQFHGVSIQQMRAVLASASCPVAEPTSNHPPTVAVPDARTIPIGTPIQLVAEVADPDGDPVTVSWEQLDAGPPVSLPIFDLGSNPLAPVLPASPSPVRLVPALETLLSGIAAPAETLPTTDRVLRWRAVARDNRPDAGGVAWADTTLTATTRAGPFRVLAPAGGETLSGLALVQWQVAATDLPPVACSKVSISASLDGGRTWSTLLSATANDGAETVVLPDAVSDSLRIKVEAAENVFFAISQGDSRLIRPADIPLLAGPIAVDDASGNGNGFADPGESSLLLHPSFVNAGGARIAGLSLKLESLTPTAAVTAAPASFPEIPPGGSATSLEPFFLDLAPDHPCGAPVRILLTLALADGRETTRLADLPTGRPGAPATRAISFTGPPVQIPDGGAVEIPLDVSLDGLLDGVEFRFAGAACSAAAAAPTVGLSHTFVGDLVATLISPAGTEVVLFSRAGGRGNNLCATLLRDDPALPSIQSAPFSAAPFSGEYRPAGLLGAFRGEPASGRWRLRLEDRVIGDTGAVRSFALLLTLPGLPECDPAPVDCIADIVSIGGYPPRDGLLTVDDYTTFINAFAAGDPLADVVSIGGFRPRGHGVTVDDLLAFLNAFAADCQ